jgi:uncharacterized membrane protein SpoIIM required for sporulation
MLSQSTLFCKIFINKRNKKKNMVVEALISPMKAEEQPWQMLILGFIYSSIAIGLAYKIAPSQSSMLMVFFTVMACMPIVYNTIKYEEEKDEKCADEKVLLKEHWKALKVFIYLFIGMTISFSFWNLVLPERITWILFSSQIATIAGINGNATDIFASFWPILFNNLQVLFYCIIFSFIYGIGAIFILAWNASIIGMAIADFIKVGVAELAQTIGSTTFANYLHIYSCGFFVRYFPHGILEILAYFTAGLAGGILSVAIIRHRAGTKRFMDIIFDSADLLLISLAILFIAAIVEVLVTPSLVLHLC